MLTIAQITDLHITTEKNPLNRARNETRLRQVLKAIHALKPRPVAIIASGDLVDRGEPDEYVALKKIFEEVEIPLYLGLGNHDRRATFRAAFPQTPVDENGFVQYAADLGGMRLLMCDTLDEGKNQGAFCERRAAELKRMLDADARAPIIVALHHPPIVSGIRWMDPQPDAQWIRRLAETIKDRPQIQSLICGHLHRAFHGMLAGQLVAASPATSIQLTLNLTPVDMRVPDGREILVEEPPGYTLLMWDKERLTTHVCVAGDFAPAVMYKHPFQKD